MRWVDRALVGVGVALAIVLVLVLIFAGVTAVFESKCSRRAEALGRESVFRYGPGGGCFVVVDGREIPLGNVVVEVER